MSQAILFSGQGAQKVGMGLSLYENSARVRELYDEADAVLGWSLKQISFYGPEESLTETKVCQPALYVMGYAIYELLKEAGHLNDCKAALGLSLGELTALAAAESFDFATGLRIVAERGRLMQMACDATNGGMASFIGGSAEAVEQLAKEHDVDMANLNCPGQIVISGESAKVDAAVAAGKALGVFRMVMPLKVAGAYHSRLMQPAKEAFGAFLREIEIKTPRITVFTNVTGKPVIQPDEIRAALEAQVVSSVRWEDCMRNAAALEIGTFYECGPGAVLGGLAKRTEKSWRVISVAEHAELPA
jgi:[acyl-carrier-protein] S-malonyltransferase